MTHKSNQPIIEAPFVSLKNIFHCKIFSNTNDFRENNFFTVFVCILGKCSGKYSTRCVWSNVKQIKKKNTTQHHRILQPPQPNKEQPYPPPAATNPTKIHHKINKNPITGHHKPTKPTLINKKNPPPTTTNQQKSTTK